MATPDGKKPEEEEGFMHFDGNSGPKCSSHHVPLILVLPRAPFLRQAVGMFVDTKGSSMNVSSDFTSCRSKSINSISGVIIMSYHQLVEYLSSCS